MTKLEILNEINELSSELKEVERELLNDLHNEELNKRHEYLTIKMDIATSKWGWC